LQGRSAEDEADVYLLERQVLGKTQMRLALSI
jgi:hypothetical protein